MRKIWINLWWLWAVCACSSQPEVKCISFDLSEDVHDIHQMGLFSGFQMIPLRSDPCWLNISILFHSFNCEVKYYLWTNRIEKDKSKVQTTCVINNVWLKLYLMLDNFIDQFPWYVTFDKIVMSRNKKGKEIFGNMTNIFQDPSIAFTFIECIKSHNYY